MPSSWNADRSERSRAVRRAMKFVGNRVSRDREMSGRLQHPLMCHVLPLGRIWSDDYDDRLAQYADDVSRLVPPGFTDTYTRFGTHSIEILSDPYASDSALTWFRSGGVELSTRPNGRGVGLARMIDEVIPWLGKTICHMAGPPVCVAVTVSGDPRELRLEPPPLEEGTRILPAREVGIVMLPPAVIDDGREFTEFWPSRAERLLTHFAQAFGRPSFDRSRWRPPAPEERGRRR